MTRVSRNVTGLRKALCGSLCGAALLLTAPAAGFATPDVDLDVSLAQNVLAAGRSQRLFIRVSLEGIPALSRRERAPVNVALVLDRSGSMRGTKLARAKAAAIMALDRLGRDDIAAVIAYDDSVETLLSATRLRDPAAARARIETIEAGGRTALYAGTRAGLREVRRFLRNDRVNRVILLSDGLANVGPSTPAELGRLGRAAGSEGISITTIGLGLGYNEDLMARLAGASDGNHAFVEHPEDLVEVFDREFGDVLSVVAQDIEIVITLRDGYRLRRVLGRDAEMNGRTARLRLNQINGGQRKYVLLEVEIPAARAVVGRADIADVTIRYSGMANGARKSARRTVTARFTTSPEEAAASVNNAVMADISAQIATENSERAIELRDRGDLAGARKVLEENAAYLRAQARKLDAPALDRLGRESEATAGRLSEGEWGRTRKALRASQHRWKYQQGY